MLNKKFFTDLKKDYQNQISERRQIISAANNILHDAKRVIFSSHRGDLKSAAASLADIEARLKKLETNFGYNRLNQEGAYTAACEEYAEAKLFYLVLTGKKLEKFKGIKISTENYLGGLSDLLGEMVRWATNLAADGKIDEAKKVKNLADDIMAELVNFDMTGYLRTKYDQARGHLRKMEQINYELSLRK
jgi:predicted translin family RNA/ssDNA-binding protein